MKRPEQPERPCQAMGDLPCSPRWRELAVVHSGELGWRSRGGWRTSSAMLVQARGRELLVLSDARPGRSGPVCVRLTWPWVTPWLPVTVVRGRRTRLGPHQLRLRATPTVIAAAFATLSGIDPRSN